MKSSQHFKETIKNYLDKRAAEDELFAANYQKPHKSLEECCNYVLKCAKDGGCAGYTDEEVFGWAVHYYDEDNIKDVAAISANVIINRGVELSEEEKEKAKKVLFETEKSKYIPEIKEQLKNEITLSPEEIEEAKQKARELAVTQALEKMTAKSKKNEAKPENKEEVQPTLFG